MPLLTRGLLTLRPRIRLFLFRFVRFRIPLIHWKSGKEMIMAPEAQAQKQPTPALLFDTFNAYQLPQAIKAGIDLEVFTAIGKAKTTAKKIADRCGASK